VQTAKEPDPGFINEESPLFKRIRDLPFASLLSRSR
jgi:hypothetical protein